MNKVWKLLTFGLLCSMSFVCAQSTPKLATENSFAAKVKPRCTFTAPSNDRAEYLQIDTDARDGFADTFQASDGNRRLSFTYLCNGTKADITFGHPQKVSGPTLYANTFYTTVLSSAPNNPLSSGNATKTLTAHLPTSSTPKTIYFTSIIYNGGVNKVTGRVPLLAGVYKFILQATIAAGM